jgi:hypothetical protein
MKKKKMRMGKKSEGTEKKCVKKREIRVERRSGK